MKSIIPIIRSLSLSILALVTFAASSLAQEVSVPDPGLNLAIREALQKPDGPLTAQDLLSLTNLNARGRNVRSIAGLEAAAHLTSLDLQSNLLSQFSLPNALTNLEALNLSLNSLTNCNLVDGLANLTSLIIQDNALTNFALPEGLQRLTTLDLDNNRITSFSLPADLTSLKSLDIGFNTLVDFTLPSRLTNLANVIIAGNQLTNIALPAGFTQLTNLDLSQNELTKFSLPPGMTNLLRFSLFFNSLSELTLPSDLMSLISLDLDENQLIDLSLPSNLSHLNFLRLRANQLTHFVLPAGMAELTYLDLGENQLNKVTLPGDLNRLHTLRLSGNQQLRDFTLPNGMTNLSGIFLRFNQLTNLTLPSDLIRLATLDVLGNQLADLKLPTGLTNLAELIVSGNQLTILTLPPDMTTLNSLVPDGNPLNTLVLPTVLAESTLTNEVASLQGRGVSIFTYPLEVHLIRLRQPIGAFQFAINGPPAIYAVLGSTNLLSWTELHTVTNQLGNVVFTDADAHLYPQRFYRTVAQNSPANMVYIPPTIFTMGSPAGEVNRNINEGPQTIVTLSRGFWIGKYEVTQGEYLSVMNTNPSVFPGDSSRPVSNVSWPDATNYCALLTQRELAAGRISEGSQYRLPTEAEWECAARAGTNTRFSYGDDPDYANLKDHAWYFMNAALMVHPVGKKLPNSWGLYDMEGNVWEWCEDWLGDLPGGMVTDPQGPASNSIGWKVIRGGGYDSGESDTRSARRYFFGNHPGLTDSNLGFRVVFVPGAP